MGRVVKSWEYLRLSDAQPRHARAGKPNGAIGVHTASAVTPVASIAVPITDPADPRWVLAVRTGEQLQGAILTPERRERLLRLARVIGLNPFDANLVIAIVQDQARRGVSGGDCAGAAAEQLAIIARPNSRVAHPRKHLLATIAGVAALLVMELFILLWLLG